VKRGTKYLDVLITDFVGLVFQKLRKSEHEHRIKIEKCRQYYKFKNIWISYQFINSQVMHLQNFNRICIGVESWVSFGLRRAKV